MRPRCAFRNLVLLGCSIAAVFLRGLGRGMLRSCLSHSRRDCLWRLLTAAGLSRLLHRAARGSGALRDAIALVDPNFDADAAETAGDADAHSLRAALHGAECSLLDRAAVRDAPLDLLGDGSGHQGRFHFGQPYFVDVDANATSAYLLQPAAQLIHPLSAATDDDTWTGSVNGDGDLVRVSLYLDTRDTGIRQHFLDRAADREVFVQLFGVVLIREPLAVPVVYVTETETVGVHLLTHQAPSSTMMVMLLRRRRIMSARPRARGIIRRSFSPSPTNACVT